MEHILTTILAAVVAGAAPKLKDIASTQTNRLRVTMALVVLSLPLSSFSTEINADSLSELVGYTIVAASTVQGEFEGADFDMRVKLDNGMIFEFTEYSYSYSYRPSVVVFARVISIEELSKLLKKPATRAITLYKLVVEDEMYDVRRVK